MKRLLAIALVALFAVSLLAGCKPAVYKDGTYTAVSDATDKGYMKADVTIKGDKITAVKLYGYNNLGMEKPSTYAHAEYHKVLSDLPAAMVKNNKAKVDIVAKATGSSNQSIQAVERAMEKALAKPASSAKYFDGTFMSVSAPDARGSWTMVWVTVANDKITDVLIHSTTSAKEKDAEGNLVLDAEGKSIVRKDANGNTVFERKGADYAYAQYHEARTALKDAFIAKNGVEIDTFTGATSTTNQSKEAVTNALNSALRK